MAKYILDENNNKIEVTDEVLTATVNEVKCCVSSTPFKMAFVTQAKYNELEATGLVQPNTIYEILDDTMADDIDAQLKEHQTTLAEQTAKLEEHTNRFSEMLEYVDSKHLYRHNLRLLVDGYNRDPRNYVEVYLTIYDTNKDAITLETLPSYFTDVNIYREATGRVVSGSVTGLAKYVKKAEISTCKYYVGYGETYTSQVTDFETVTDVVEQVY